MTANEKIISSIILIFSVIAVLAIAVLVFRHGYMGDVAPSAMPRVEERSADDPGETIQDVPPASADEPAPPALSWDTSLKPEIVWGNRTKQQVIFTFDAGAGVNSAFAILDILSSHGVIGTFFLTGKFAEQYPEIAKDMSDQGHEIFNHTYSHPDLRTVSDEKIVEEFQKTEEIISALTGKSTRPYFRPPYGGRNPHVWEVAAAEEDQSIYWTVDALDWKESEGFTDEQVKDRIFANLKPGTIYMMHIGDNITGRVLDEVLTEIKNQGYEIVPLSEGVK